jgi:hypothetical protein
VQLAIGLGVGADLVQGFFKRQRGTRAVERIADSEVEWHILGKTCSDGFSLSWWVEVFFIPFRGNCAASGEK